MQRIKNLPEGDFLRLLFCFLCACFLIAAIVLPDRGQMLAGLWRILSSPSKVSTSYFYLGGFSATFLNMGLVGLILLLLYCLPGAQVSNTSCLAFILTVGFGSWGINILNIWPSMLGVVLYSLVKGEKLSSLVNPMIFSTGLAPLITDLLIRYPHDSVIGFNLPGLGMALLVGCAIGFFLPAGLEASPRIHKGFSLYSAALPVGMTAFLLNGTLYKTLGITLPAAPDAATLALASRTIVNVFCITLFSSLILISILMGCRWKDYKHLLSDPALVTNFTSAYGNHVFLMNVGVYGLVILAYYNLVGATFNGITFGIIFCMLACCNSGAHPGNVIPIMIGYIVAALGFQGLSTLVGGSFTGHIGSLPICVGLCYASGLAPISDRYGWPCGVLAAVLHYLLVTSVPNLHGGFCLYNGGFTAGLICIILVPELERFLKTKDQRKLPNTP